MLLQAVKLVLESWILDELWEISSSEKFVCLYSVMYNSFRDVRLRIHHGISVAFRRHRRLMS